MFIKSVKVKNPRLWLGVFIIVIAAAALWAALKANAKAAPVYSLRTEAERQAFISEMGWETDSECLSCKSVTIPEEWNDVYEQYNKLQKQQGFDLEKFRGKTVEIYTYAVHNYEGYEDKDTIRLTLMVSDGELIGGDVCCTELAGFMQGLKK